MPRGKSTCQERTSKPLAMLKRILPPAPLFLRTASPSNSELLRSFQRRPSRSGDSSHSVRHHFLLLDASHFSNHRDVQKSSGKRAVNTNPSAKRLRSTAEDAPGMSYTAQWVRKGFSLLSEHMLTPFAELFLASGMRERDRRLDCPARSHGRRALCLW